MMLEQSEASSTSCLVSWLHGRKGASEGNVSCRVEKMTQLVNNWSGLAYWLVLSTYALLGGSCKPNILSSTARHGYDGSVSATDFGRKLGLQGEPQAPNGGRGCLKHIIVGLRSTCFDCSSPDRPVGAPLLRCCENFGSGQ